MTEDIQTFLACQVQLSSLYIGISQPGPYADPKQRLSWPHPLLRRKQPGHQQSTFLLEQRGQPESEGERDHVPARLFIGGQRFYLKSEMPQALLIAMLEEASRLDQSTQQAQTPLDQRYLGAIECRFLPAAQEPFHPHDGPLHLDLHARTRRLCAQIDGVE